MEGAEFAIHAKETIYTPDGQKDEAGNRIVKYEKDALVARMVTDKEGKAVLNNLPIGKYYVVEEKAGQNCVLDPEAKEFEIAYKGHGSSSGLCNNGTYQSATESFPEYSEERRRNRKTAGRSGIRAVCAGEYQKCCRGSSCRKRCPD